MHASPLNGLMRKVHASLFTLTLNGNEIGVGEVASINDPAEKDPGDRFALISAGDNTRRDDELIRRVDKVSVQEGVAGGAESVAQAEGHRGIGGC